MINKPRKPWLAGLLSLMADGLGHIYSGSAKRGIWILILVVFLLLPVVLFIFSLPTPWSVGLGLLTALSIKFFIIFDSVRIAKNKKSEYLLKPFNKLWVYVCYACLFSLIVEYYPGKYFIAQAFKIPTSSMSPALIVGDHIMSDKWTYRFHSPERGDIVIFKFPKNEEKIFIKRIIGMPGETLEIKDQQVFINTRPLNQHYALLSPEFPENTDSKNLDFGPVTISDKAYFVMGDNWDNSHDSRHWGFLDANKILGKATTIYWSWDSILLNTRWDRIGKKLNH